MKLLNIFSALFLVASAFAQTPPVIDVSKAPAPLYEDPVTHGGTDPFVIWNPVKNEWFMYYTQRRSNLAHPQGVDWVHGSPRSSPRLAGRGGSQRRGLAT